MRPDLERAWAAMQAESVRTGLPRHWRTDLEIDRRGLELPEFPRVFVWILRECGTQLYAPCRFADVLPGAEATDNAMLYALDYWRWHEARERRDLRWYWWDGHALRRTTGQRCHELLAAAIRAALQEGPLAPLPLSL